MAKDRVTRDRFLSEAIGEHSPMDFSTWNGYGRLVKWLEIQPLWIKIRWHMSIADFMALASDADRFADYVYQELKKDAPYSVTTIVP